VVDKQSPNLTLVHRWARITGRHVPAQSSAAPSDLNHVQFSALTGGCHVVDLAAIPFKRRLAAKAGLAQPSHGGWTHPMPLTPSAGTVMRTIPVAERIN
jgi:hypothetical protein